MPTLKNKFAGIDCINPFWLASAPPTNCGEQIMRAFDAGWGGAVWKTIGEPITNVSSRYSSIDFEGRKMMGFNNIELISDRPIETNLREIAEVKRRYPKHAKRKRASGRSDSSTIRLGAKSVAPHEDTSDRRPDNSPISIAQCHRRRERPQ